MDTPETLKMKQVVPHIKVNKEYFSPHYYKVNILLTPG